MWRRLEHLSVLACQWCGIPVVPDSTTKLPATLPCFHIYRCPGHQKLSNLIKYNQIYQTNTLISMINTMQVYFKFLLVEKVYKGLLIYLGLLYGSLNQADQQGASQQGLFSTEIFILQNAAGVRFTVLLLCQSP